MKKLIIAVVAFTFATSVMASSTATVSFKLKHSKTQLWGYVEMTGLTNCPRPGVVMMEWTPPAGATDFIPVTVPATWKSCSDEGMTHTWTYRTIEMKVHGKKVRATGVWKCRILGAENKVLAEADFTVE